MRHRRIEVERYRPLAHGRLWRAKHPDLAGVVLMRLGVPEWQLHRAFTIEGLAHAHQEHLCLLANEGLLDEVTYRDTPAAKALYAARSREECAAALAELGWEEARS